MFEKVETFETTLFGHDITITIDGTVFSYPVCTAGVVLDEARLAAASHYLDRAFRLTARQRRFWHAQSLTTRHV